MLFLSAATMPVAVQTWASTVTVNASGVGQVKLTLGGNTTINMNTTGSDGQRVMLELIQDGVGNRTVTLGTGFSWGSDITSFSNTATAGKTDYIGLIYCAATTSWRVIAIAKGY